MRFAGKTESMFVFERASSRAYTLGQRGSWQDGKADKFCKGGHVDKEKEIKQKSAQRTEIANKAPANFQKLRELPLF